MAHGWRVRGYDLKPPAEVPDGCEFVQADILSLTLSDIADADFICCSSPCEQFSVHCMKHFHKNPPYPAKGIELFERGRELCGSKPHVMENVRCAERFVGRAVNHCGPFYLWGNAVPAVMPQSLFALQKGIAMGNGADARKLTGEALAAYRGKYKAWLGRDHKEAASRVATIPLELASYVAQVTQVAP